ncbi:MAG: hypothetical protein B6227_03200 [Fusobacteriia bacterium 4572_74]|nr:MAG: hypothetical protein B6227_03200 [Fusobacteriia bacterium 4572_74]
MILIINIATGEAVKRKYTSQDIDKKNPVILFGELAESVGVTLEEEENKILEMVVDGLLGGKN